MRRRRDPFARCTYVPKIALGATCKWCGYAAMPRHPVYQITVEDDQHGRDVVMRGAFESWSCAESYHDGRIGR